MKTLMKNVLPLAIVTATFVFLAAPALADWDPGDGHKMHFPQMPDPFGWDVNFTEPKVLADDWLCTMTGPVEDIHFWFSARGDQLPPDMIDNIHVSIHDDDRSGPFSKPGNLLWEADYPAGSFVTRDWGTGQQGFYDPNTGEAYPDDHFQIYQANITDITDPFIQEEGNIYWLDLSVTSLVPFPGLEYGWKTSLDHFEDAAVWSDFGGAGADWQPLHDPFTGEALDLAFVITGREIPEPGTVMMFFSAGLMGLVAFARRRKRA